MTSCGKRFFPKLNQLILQIYPRGSETVSRIKLKVNAYCESKVEFLAEVPSRKGVQCNHSTSDHSGRIYHEIQSSTGKQNIASIGKLQQLFIKAKECIHIYHTICVQKASEVLVFLVSNMDRIHIQDLPHAFPIAIAFKGYSMTSETMRYMLKQVLHALFSKGLYVSVYHMMDSGQNWLFRLLQVKHFKLFWSYRKKYIVMLKTKKCQT